MPVLFIFQRDIKLPRQGVSANIAPMGRRKSSYAHSVRMRGKKLRWGERAECAGGTAPVCRHALPFQVIH